MPYVKTDSQHYSDIADAIREKNGLTNTYKPSQMAAAIAEIDAGDSGAGSDSINHEDIPDYVKAEAQSVAARVAAKMQNDSIVFMVGSDSHESDTAHVADGNLHAGMAMKALAYVLPFDFAAFLGDYTTGSSTTTIEEGLGQIAQINADIADAFQGLPQFRTVGNHDPLGYSYSQNGESLGLAELYQLIGKYNEDSGATMGSTTSGYCYRDFASKSVRVICLNTAEADADGNQPPHGSAEFMTTAQKCWFADTLISTPQDYGIIVLCHHPLDWGKIVIQASHILRAYVEELAPAQQNQINFGSGVTYDFTGKNKSAWVLQFHGHVHTFTVDNLHYVENITSSTTANTYDVKRIACPNMCFVRNNEYGRNSGFEYYDIEFGTSDTYNKTANSGDDTAFCVMVVNPTEQKVHAICYGAGYDRVIGMDGKVYYSITNNLANISTSNDVSSVEVGASYAATLTPDSGYEIGQVTITMGGVDITGTTYSSGTINIPNVSGNIVITAIAAVNATNIVPTMLTPKDYSTIFQGVGYKDDSYVRGVTTGTEAGYVATGLYRLTNAADIDYIYIRGADITTIDHCRFILCRDDDNNNISYVGKGSDANGWKTGVEWISAIDQLGTKYWRLTLSKEFANTYMTSTIRVMQMSVQGVGAELFISINNPISDDVYNEFLGA